MARALFTLLAAVLVLAPRTEAAPSASALDALYLQYTHGDPDVITRTLTADAYSAIRGDLLAALPRWREDWQPAHATFSLEVAIVAFSNEWPDASTVLLGARDLVMARRDPIGRVGAMDRFEVRFHECALALLTTFRFDMVDAYLFAIASRVTSTPDPRAPNALIEPRLALVRALWNEKRVARSPIAGTGNEPISWRIPSNDFIDRKYLEDALAAADIAAAADATRAEGQLHRGFILYRLGRDTEALQALVEAGSSPDASVRYLALLVQGNTLVALDRLTEAASVFEDSARTVPGTQTPAIALAALNLRLNRPTDAVRWATMAETSSDRVVDPWWQYFQGDVRWLNAWVHEMRAAS